MDAQIAKTVVIAGSCLAFVWFACGRWLKKANYPLPPGPKGIPFLGSVYDIPTVAPWKTYREWSQLYNSDIIYFNVMGTSVFVLNSLAAVRELLEKRSSFYSSRPNMPMLNDMYAVLIFRLIETLSMGLIAPQGSALIGISDSWKRRRMFQQAFHASQMSIYRPRSSLEVRKLLVRILRNKSDIRDEVRLMAGSFILSVTYSIDVQSDSDPYIQQAERGMQAMAAAGTASSYLVDFFPALKYIPKWMPGAKFKREAREWRKDVTAMPRTSLEFVKDGMRTNSVRTCVASRLLETLPEDAYAAEIEEKAISDVLGSAYAAGSDTTVSAINAFILTMVLNPEVQKKGQDYVDSAIGRDRLPDYSDYETIPYIEAIVREVFRWNPVTPFALPHCNTMDDVYNGYHIPKGSTILPNAWAISHDELIYGSDTHLFRPERFLTDEGKINPDIRNPEEAFGFGRRICPGMHIAVESIWMTVASILAAFNIRKAVDDDGIDIEPSGEFSTGLLSHPLPFQCKISPRSDAAAALIRDLDFTGEEYMA